MFYYYYYFYFGLICECFNCYNSWHDLVNSFSSLFLSFVGKRGYIQHDVSFDREPKMSAVNSQSKKKQQVFSTERTTKTQRWAAGNAVPESSRRVSPKPSTSKSGKDSQSPKKLEKPSKPLSKAQKGGCNNRGRL